MKANLRVPDHTWIPSELLGQPLMFYESLIESLQAHWRTLCMNPSPVRRYQEVSLIEALLGRNFRNMRWCRDAQGLTGAEDRNKLPYGCDQLD